MSEDDPITRREFAIGIKGITDRLDTLNGSVADNTRFRVQGNAVLKALGFVWVSIMVPLTAIAVAMLA